ncbi:TetR/AcrR family transcriptional regulator [Spongiactinospora sp. TRM90649]|uniref:TetR/AcrR family transcriptional regulator n=1 Tax=Spongiactinospora sp. TRM90649 TaxID=3031114 RepID=UPI0023F82A85|nr:TetR/AcrR family transcriptional regulator [Spongiactinospora sp. TRM90649]MDF5757056.1 TetR/AcrR family transcriptional regulator [Spongiactinospora sp. TRM90649]
MTTTAYERAQRIGQEAVRTAILDEAIALLTGEGPGALTVRRIATEAGCSTKVIYTLFSGKDGLVEALWVEGFARFARALGRVPSGPDPIVNLMTMGVAYREYAHAEPSYYKIMFENAIPGFTPSAEARKVAMAAFTLLESTCAAAVETGALAGDPREIADQIWMAVHGAVSLELSGFFDRARADVLFPELCRSMARSFAPPRPPER